MKTKTNENFNRKQYLQSIVQNMVNKRTPEAISGVYNISLEALTKNENNKEIAIEKRKILENCYSIFSRVEIRKAILDARMKNKLEGNNLVDLVLNIITEKVVGDRKRTYNMADKFSEDRIATRTNKKSGLPEKMVNFTPLEKVITTTLSDDSGHQFSISKSGTLFYNDGIIEESIDKYTITKKIDDNYSQNYDVFSHIDFLKLEKDPKYKQAVLNELLSINNIELSNAGGYIGEIEDTRHQPRKLEIGEQFDNPHGFYTYQISRDFALVYDYMPLTAVILYNEKNKSQSKKSAEQGR